MARGIISKADICSGRGPSRRVGRRIVREACDQVPRIVTVGRGGLPRVGYYVDCVIGIIAVTSRALFRRGARTQTSVTVISEAANLSRLIDFLDLIACVVTVSR